MHDHTFYDELEADIQKAYAENVSTDEAERLAAKFLLGQLSAGKELAALDLDERMKKTRLKSLKAAVYLENASKGDKKPSDVLLNAIVDSDKIVLTTQDSYDTAAVERARVDNFLHIFREAHLYFRAISRGRFE